MPDTTTMLRRRGRPSTTAADGSNDVQSLDRAISLLETLAGSDGLGLSEVARQADLPPSTAHRLLATLLRRGLVNQDQETGLWTVGVRLFKVGSAYLRIRKLPDLARPLMRQLLADVDETVNVSMLDRNEIVCVAQAESHSAVRAFFRLGRCLPLHASAAGKAILAASSDGFRQQMLEGHVFKRFTAETHADRASLLADVAAVGRRGWAYDDEEFTVGMRCVSAVVLNEFAEPAGAVSVSAPTTRLPRDRMDELGARVRETALRLTAIYAGS